MYNTIQGQTQPKTPPLHYVCTLTKVIAAQMQMLDQASEEVGADPLVELAPSD